MKVYHLSATDLGARVRLEPRAPGGPAIGEDKTTPRISVGLDVEDCILGKTWVHASGRTFYVYRAEAEAEEPPRWAVPDSGDTREHWLTAPAEFRRVGIIEVARQEPWQWPDSGPRFRWVR